MPTFSISDLQPGMITAADIKDRLGRPILKENTELTEKHINVLKTWGISHVEIAGNESKTSLQEIIEAHPEYLEEAQRAAEQRFQHAALDHPLIKSLRAIWQERYIKHKAGQQ